jgi:hypothetical protein
VDGDQRIREIHRERLTGDDEAGGLGVVEPGLGIHRSNDSRNLTALEECAHDD